LVHPAIALAYESAMMLAGAAAALDVPGRSKLARSLRARRGIRQRYEAWSRAGRDTARPLLWMHAPSVGEGLQARPVLERLRRARPDVQLAYTFFSPSAEQLARSVGADFHDYLPFDTRSGCRMALDALQPRALVFSKLDVWPRLSIEATSRGVRLGLLSATLAAASRRRGGLATALLREAYSRLDAVGAIHADDAERLIELGVRADAISITGDVRYDQVWQRAAAVDRSGALLAALRSDRFTMVAGSTWPTDEQPLLEGWLALRARHAGARLVLAPHEPTPEHVDPLVEWARSRGLSLTRLDDDRAAHADVVLVDRVGVLGDLYALADVAFVGGGFHAAGLHSVLEPAAFGAPVLFGPRHANSRDAALLVERGAGASIASSGELSQRLIGLAEDPASRREAGARARALVRDGLGAADRSLALVQSLLA
jgi:3-deoxy-D-manno-octulosonic-acid transferase